MKHKLTTLERNSEINDSSCAATNANRKDPQGSLIISHLTSSLTASLTLSLLMLAAPLGLSDAHAKPKLIKTQSSKAKAKSKSKAKPKAKAKAKPKAKPKNLQRVRRPSRGNSRSTARARQTPTQSRQNLRQVKGVSRAKTSGQSGARSKPANTGTPSRSVRRVGAGGSQLIKAGRSRSEGDQAGASRSGERSLVNTRTPVNSRERRSVEDRSGQAGRAAQPGSKTVTTTTKTTKTKRVERSSRSSKTVERRRRRVERRQARRRERRRDRRRDRGGFGAPPARAPSNCRPRGGRTMLNFGIGSQSVDSDQREVALSFGGGYRAGLLGIAAEVQLASREEEEATLSALRGQFRLYLPMARCADLYPLLGVSSFHGDSDNTYAIDLGLGADLNIAGAVSLGARYTHSFFTERIRDIGNEDVESVNTFIVQIGVYF